MQIKTAYLTYLELVNENATNNNVAVDAARFISSFNRFLIRYTEWILEKRNEDKLRYISVLLVPNKKLTVSKKLEHSVVFSKPDDWFDHSSLQVKVSKNSCSYYLEDVWEAKGEDTEILLFDENNSPSFKWSTTFYKYVDSGIEVFKKDFEIDEVNLYYYRYPKKVDMAGYINEFGQQSTDIDPEFDDKVVERILTAMAREFKGINSDQAGYQLQTAQLFSEI